MISLRRPHVILPALLALAAGTLMALMLAPAPALAHDTLLSSDPADGSTLEDSPETITLSYSADILDVEPVARITDADGEVVADLTPTIEGADLTAAVEDPLAAGEYQLQWRVVSSDGHPIEGTETFTVTGDADGAEGTQGSEGSAASDAGGSSAASDAGDDQAAPSDDATETAEVEESEDSGAPVLLIAIIVIAAVAVVGAVSIPLLRKKR